MSITKASKEVVFDFSVKHPQLEYSPGEGPSGRKRFDLHKNMESFSFNIGKEPFIDRYFEKVSSIGLASPSEVTEIKQSNSQSGQVVIGEVARLKALLKEKELRIKELAERIESRKPALPEVPGKYPNDILEGVSFPKLKPASDVPPERLFELSVEKSRRSPVELKPQNRSFSYEPMATLKNEMKPYASKDYRLNDLLKHPAFHQPRFAKSKPKVDQSNPITGLSPKIERMVHYGNMMMGGPTFNKA